MLLWIKAHIIEVFVGLCAVTIFFVWRSGQSASSQFRLREHERQRRATPEKAADLADARLKKREQLALPGIRLDGAPHEILGVSAQASKREIMDAYKRLMKQYHPDKVAAPGSAQWNEAQKIASAINAAKEKLLNVR
jgi:DnaJ-domain-containing protein 1